MHWHWWPKGTLWTFKSHKWSLLSDPMYLWSADGAKLLTNQGSILEHWSEHYQTLFSTTCTVQDVATDCISKQPVITMLDVPPLLEETVKAIGQLKSNKATGVDGIPPEVWINGGLRLHAKFHECLVSCWEWGVVPQDFHDTVIITLYKNKGKNLTGSIYHGITQLSITEKILARLLLSRLVPAIVEQYLKYLSESQSGLRPHWGTIDMIFALRQIQEKCWEQNKGLYLLSLTWLKLLILWAGQDWNSWRN